MLRMDNVGTATADREDTLSAMVYLFAELAGGAAGSVDDAIARCPSAVISDSKNTYDNLFKNGAYLGMKEKIADLVMKCLK